MRDRRHDARRHDASRSGDRHRPGASRRPAQAGRDHAGRDAAGDDHAGRASAQPGPPETQRIWGIHAVAAALANPARRLTALRLTDNAENRLAEAVKARGLAAERVHPRDLDRLLGTDTVHQGVLVEAEPLAAPTLEEVAAAAVAARRPLVVLDQVTDPHNVGAILRSAAVFEVAGLVMTRRNAPPLGGALAKAASGALELVPVALVANLARALGDLADLGLRRIGLDGEAEQAIEAADLSDAVALVLGSEGRGLRRLTRESCDLLVRIGGAGRLTSLNVSNAAAVALHTVAMRRRAL